MTTTPTPTIDVELLPQPNDSVCGPTCLHAVYRFFGELVELDEVIACVPSLPNGGTLAVQLGCDALTRGYRARITTNNLQSFDPTWFRPGVDLADRLARQALAKPKDTKLQLATEWYLRFLQAGGELVLESFSAELLSSYLDQGVPILAGLSATYLYGSPRELPDGTYDDVAGFPTGHFVLIQGYDGDHDHVWIADPYADNPMTDGHYYRVSLARLLAAIHLGIVTYDANLLVIQK